MPSLELHRGFCGNSIRSNPWRPDELVVTAADNFGISGTGKVYILAAQADTVPGAGAAPLQMLTGFGTPDGAFDACYSEVNPKLLVVAQGDGVRLYNTDALHPARITLPVAAPIGHTKEVVCVEWSPHKGDSFLSSSWDGTVKIWSGERAEAGPVSACVGHLKEVYEATHHPRQPHLVASASGDGTWRLWDLRSPRPGGVVAIPGHGADLVMSLDWNRYEANMLATGSVDRSVKLWDVRRPNRELLALRGHDHAVRRVRFSPHSKTVLMSAGYDYRVVVWDLQRRPGYMTHRYEQHREFVVGLEWSVARPGVAYSAGWDGRAFSWVVGKPVVPTPPQPLPPCPPPPQAPGASRLIRRGRGGAGFGGPVA